MISDNEMDLKNPNERCKYCFKVIKSNRSFKYFCELQQDAIGGNCEGCSKYERKEKFD